MIEPKLASFPWEILSLPVVIVVVLVGLAVRQVRKDRNATPGGHWAVRWAMAHGWFYQPRHDQLHWRWPDMPFVSLAGRECRDVLTGWYRGRHCVAFAFNGKSQTGPATTSWWSAGYAVFLGANLPSLYLEPGRSDSLVERMIGQTDIQFESDHFNYKWNVRSADKRFAHGVINPATIALLTRPAFPVGHYRIEGADLLHLGEAELGPATIFPALDRLIDLADQIPPYVMQQYGRR